jgi:hypothetical protein
MTYKRFLKVVLRLQKQKRVVAGLYELNVDLINFTDDYHAIITELIKEIYGNKGYDWFSWYCDENDFGQGTLQAWDKDKKPIAYSLESLWELLEMDYKLKK